VIITCGSLALDNDTHPAQLLYLLVFNPPVNTVHILPPSKNAYLYLINSVFNQTVKHKMIKIDFSIFLLCLSMAAEPTKAWNDNCFNGIKEKHTNGVRVNPENRYAQSNSDSTEQRKFWDKVIVPILKKDKAIVLNQISFPLEGDWTAMMQVNKDPKVATKEDFVKVYDQFFNSDFIKAIKKQKYSDIGISREKGTTTFTVSLLRERGQAEAGLMLEYTLNNGKYNLVAILGAGANFYDMD